MNEFEQQVLRAKHARTSFRYFVNEVFSKSLDIMKNKEWTGGPYVDDVSRWMEENKTTIRVSARDHFKSMSFYAHIMWKIFKLDDINHEVQYFSYNSKMAAYHVGKIKVAISCNPYFKGIVDNKTAAQNVISYSWQDKHADDRKTFTVTPRGLLEFKRGIHAPDIYVDDPFQDPESKLVPTKIYRINDIMVNQILDMFQNELHIAGTPQTNNDFFFDPDFTTRFNVRILPAEKDKKNEIALWPEWMDWDALMLKKKEKGEKAYNQEFLCSPAYSEDSYVTPKEYDSCMNKELIDYADEKYKKDDSDVVGGWDLAKKAHPAHYAEFKKVGSKWIQICQKWFDKWDHTEQLEWIEKRIERHGVYIVHYDDTRGELEVLDEKGELPDELEPVHFSHKRKFALATNMNKAITNGEVEFLADSRQRSQILIVNNDLQAPQSKEGHGDSFWSVCLALSEYESDNVDISIA